MNSEVQYPESVIVGLGTTGLSVARYLAKNKRDFAVVDSRENPPSIEELQALSDSLEKEIPVHFGDFETPMFNTAKRLIVNPGLPVSTPEIQKAKNAGAEVLGDVELFAQANKDDKPIIAITGSNGKTTVTTLLDLMAKKSGVNVSTGGNIGLPALDLLENKNAELFVLELSSYQLETTPSLSTLTAVILNISEDHLDRYENDIEKYAEAKALIYQQCEHIIYNREDEYSTRFAKRAKAQNSQQNILSFGLNDPKENEFGLKKHEHEEWLAHGETLLMPISNIKQLGKHNVANSLAALALGHVAGLKTSAMLEVLEEYPGMIHRTQWLATIEGANWYNDSKGTNVGATIAALSGLPGKTVLIAGGQGKGADFFPLQAVIKEKARAVILMGEDASIIAKFIDKSVSVIFVESMEQAVSEAYKLAKGDEKDNVLLSPACASFDMFDNYAARGDIFIQIVKDLEMSVKERNKHV